MNFVPVNELSTYLLLEETIHLHQMCVIIMLFIIRRLRQLHVRHKVLSRPHQMLTRIPSQVQHLDRIISNSDTECLLNLRMDWSAFGRLCKLLREFGGLHDEKYVSVEEQVAMFLSVLAHHKKNQVIGFNFQRSGQIILWYLYDVLRAVIKLHTILLVKPTPVEENNTDSRWKWFPGCLGLLDGTYILVHVKNVDKSRYRNRKYEIATNVLAECDLNLRFVYVLVVGKARLLMDEYLEMQSIEPMAYEYHAVIEKWPLAKAYRYRGEPEFHNLCELFGFGDIKEEDARVIINLSSTNDGDTDSRIPMHIMQKDKEVTSPVVKTTRRKLFDDGELSTTDLAPKKMFEAPVAGPRTVSQKGKGSGCKARSSCASISPNLYFSTLFK